MHHLFNWVYYINMSEIRQLMRDLYCETYVFTVYLYQKKQTKKGTVQLLIVRQEANKTSESKPFFFHAEICLK